MYILHGDGELIIDDRAFDVAADQLYLVMPEAWYLFRAAAGKAYEFVSIHFDWSYQSDSARVPLFRLADDPPTSFRPRACLPAWNAVKNPFLNLRGRPRVRRLMEEMVAGFRIWDELSQYEAAGLLAAAFGQIVREARALALLERYENAGASAIGRVEQARQLLEAPSGPPLSIAEVAARVGWSADHLRRMCHTVLGTSPVKLQRSALIARARELLREDGLPIHEVASICGFEDQAYFGRVFKAETGFTPGEYRLRVRA